MMLYEEGRFQLDDPIIRYLPAFSGQRVFAGGGYGAVMTEPAVRDITFRDLLTHTSGLTYGFMQATPVDAAYRQQKIELPGSAEPLGEIVARLAKVPLIAQPGTEWNYSVSTDVLGHLVAVISGQPFDAFLRERVLRPSWHGGYGFLRALGQGRSLCLQLRQGTGRPAAADRGRRGEPLPRAADRPVRWRRAGRHGARLHAVLPDVAGAWRLWLRRGCLGARP